MQSDSPQRSRTGAVRQYQAQATAGLGEGKEVKMETAQKKD
jgi:hypothetical protein